MQQSDDPQMSDDFWSPGPPVMNNIDDTLNLDEPFEAFSELEEKHSQETEISSGSGGSRSSSDQPADSEKAHRGPTQMSVEQWLESLRRTDRTFYNMMAMEVWSIAKSMDTLIPGFWSKFMANRQTAMKKFIHEKRSASAGLRLEDLEAPDSVKDKSSQN